MKTSELQGPALDWAVCKAEGNTPVINPKRFGAVSYGRFTSELGYAIKHYSTDWSQSGPIIEREGIELRRGNPLYFPKGNESGDHYEPLWLAEITRLRANVEGYAYGSGRGSTPLIAAMRCYVASKFGDEVDIPQELQC